MPLPTTADESDLARLDERRREYADLHRTLVDAQKVCAKERRFDDARWLSAEASEAMKHYRGTCIALGMLAAAPSGDCQGLIPNADLAPYIDRAMCGFA